MSLAFIEITVLGKPQQRGSKEAMVRYDQSGQPITKNGRVLTFAKDSNEKSGPWMQEVRGTAVAAHRGGLIRGWLKVSLNFYYKRPLGHYGKGRNEGVLKASAPAYPSQKDVDKLARAVHDGLSGAIYVDDRYIVDSRSRKHYGTPERVEIIVEELEGVV